MSKNSQDNFYYEIGVTRNGNLIKEYVTKLPIIQGDSLVHNSIVGYLKKLHGYDVVLLLNKKNGNLPKDSRPIIDIEIPKAPELKYNK